MSEPIITQISMKLDSQHRVPLPHLVWRELETDKMTLRMLKFPNALLIILIPDGNVPPSKVDVKISE